MWEPGSIAAGVAAGVITVGVVAFIWVSRDEAPKSASARDAGVANRTEIRETGRSDEPRTQKERPSRQREKFRGSPLPETLSDLRYDPAPAIAISLDAVEVRKEAGEWKRVVRLDEVPQNNGSDEVKHIEDLTIELQSMRADFGAANGFKNERPSESVASDPPNRSRGDRYALLVERTTPFELLRRVLKSATAANGMNFDVVARTYATDSPRPSVREKDSITALDPTDTDIRIVEIEALPPSTPSRDGEARQIDLTIEIRPTGFAVEAEGALLPPQDGCPWDGPTVCLSNRSSKPNVHFARARDAALDGRRSHSEELLERGINSYDFTGLYRQISNAISDNSDISRYRITGSPDAPFELVIRVLDALRQKLELPGNADEDTFWTRAADASDRPSLLADPLLSVQNRH